MQSEKGFDKAGKSFSTAIKVCTITGLIVMIIFGFLYFIGMNPLIDLMYTINNWDKTSDNFWRELSAGKEYPRTWFLVSIGKTDSLSIMGIIILTLSPLFALISILNKVDKIYRYMIILLIIELAFSIIKPFI